MSILRKSTQPKCLIYQKAQKEVIKNCSEDEAKSLEWPQNILYVCFSSQPLCRACCPLIVLWCSFGSEFITITMTLLLNFYLMIQISVHRKFVSPFFLALTSRAQLYKKLWFMKFMYLMSSLCSFLWKRTDCPLTTDSQTFVSWASLN